MKTIILVKAFSFICISGKNSFLKGFTTALDILLCVTVIRKAQHLWLSTRILFMVTLDYGLGCRVVDTQLRRCLSLYKNYLHYRGP